MRVFVVDAVHHRGLEHGVGADFQCAQGAGGIGGEDGVAGAAAEDDDLTGFQRGDGLVAGEHLGHLGHEGTGHDHGGHTLLAQGILDGQRVHHGSQHADLISVHAVHLTAGTAAPEVAAADHDADLGAQVVGGLDAGADGSDGLLIKAGALGTGESLAADFQQDTFILNCHNTHLLRLPHTGTVNHCFIWILFYNNLAVK